MVLAEAVTAGNTIWIETVLSDHRLPPSRRQTRRGRLRDFVRSNLQYADVVEGLYPSPETVLELVEQRYEPIIETNLDQMNKMAAAIVRKIGRPVVERFLRTELAQYLEGSGKISIPEQALADFLIDDYVEFSRKTANGLVSIAGSLNEHLLVRAMTNGGIPTNSFSRTGKNSTGDLVVHSTAHPRPNLNVEIKSYHARERLLRGLQDAQSPKIGVGFFQDPREFNAARTVTLLQADPAAIYMPSSTLSRVDATARSMTTTSQIAHGSRLYRPIEQIVTDLHYFIDRAILPQY